MIRSQTSFAGIAAAASAAMFVGAQPALADLTWNPTFNTTTSGATAADGVSMYGNGKANWLDSTTGLPYTGTISQSAGVNQNLIINSGYINAAQASPLGGNLYLGSTGSLTVTGGILRMSSASFSVVGAIGIAGNVDIAGVHATVNISGGLVICSLVQDSAVTLSGDGVLRLGGNSSVPNTSGANGDPIDVTTSVNITSENARLEFARKDAATVIADHGPSATNSGSTPNGEITIDGAAIITGGDPALWEPGDNCVITTVATNQYPTFTTVRKQTAAYGSCVNAGGCTLTYQATCAGAWTQDGSCTGSCMVTGVCTPVTDSAACAGAYTLAGTCTPTLFQPLDPGFESADFGSIYGNGTTGFAGTAALNSRISTWYDADDFTSQVVLADGTTIPATIHDGGSKWGRLSLPLNSSNAGGVWTRIGNYDPAHGEYTVAMDVGDRLSTTFSSLKALLIAGNFTPTDNFTPQELGGTAVSATATVTEASITWSSTTSTAARNGSISVTLPIAVAAGITPQAGDALWLHIFNNSASANVALIDNVAVLGSCCALDATCTMTRQGECASPLAWNINTACVTSPCIAPTGECCVSNTCSVATFPDCASMSGVWSVGGSCTPGPCNAPIGNCCIIGNCTLSVQSTCAGSWTLNGSCSPNPCLAQCCDPIGLCTLATQASCTGTWTIAGGVCDPNPCPQPTASCCNNATGACTLIFSGSCTAGSTAGVGTTCDTSACPATTSCCNNTSGACIQIFGGSCATGSTAGVGTTCDTNACPVVRVCCNNTSGLCAPMYGGTACASGTTIGTGLACDVNSCPVLRVCCNNTSGLCAPMYGGTVCATGSTIGSGLTCDVTTCDVVRGACCQQGGGCAAMFTADCAALANPGTYLGTGIACPSGVCVGEHEPNSGGTGSFSTNPANLASGDSLAGIATGGSLDSSGNGNGTASNGFVDFWLLSTTAAAPAIYRHEMNQIRGGTGQNWTIRGLGQTPGAVIPGGNIGVQQSISSAARTMAWYGFGKQEQLILETASGSSTPYVYQLTDTPVTPTVAAGTLSAGAITIRVIDNSATGIDSDTWLYDSNFNALANDPTDGPGGIDGQFATSDPANTTSSFVRTLPAGTYYLAVSPANLCNDQPNDPIENISATGANQRLVLNFPNGLLSSIINSSTDYTASVQLVDAANNTVSSADLSWPIGSYGLVNFVQFTVGAGGTTGVCCRGSTCNTSVAQADCTGSGTAGAFFAASATCNSGTVSNSPCCYADYNKVNGVNVQDIFDFLSGWFAGSPYAKVGSDGTSGALTVQSIFDFLSNWFTGGC